MSKATANSDTWQQTSGLRTTRTYLQPVNYRATDGTWEPIDDTLIAGLGGYENTANSFTLRIPESIAAGISLTNEAASVTFTTVGAATAIAAVSRNTAIYREALRATDLEYVSESDGLQESATLKSAEAPHSISYRLALSPGLRPQQTTGAITIRDAQGTAHFTIPTPTATAQSHPNEAHILPTSVVPDEGGWRLTVDLSQAWLRTALHEGPVRVDPTIKESIHGEECSLEEEHPTTPNCETKQPLEGYDATHTEHHDLLQFAGAVFRNTRILHATLALKVFAHSTSNAKAIAVYPVSHSWNSKPGSGATWKEYESGHNWTNAGGDYLAPPGNSDSVSNPAVGVANTTYFWYPTKMVQNWANTAAAPNGAGYADYGFMVKDEKDNTTANLLELEKNGSYLETVWQYDGEGTASQDTYWSEALTDNSTLSVNVGSGDLMLTNKDMAIPGVAGLDFASTRTWNSFSGDSFYDGHPAPYGGWIESNYSQNHALVFPDGTVAIEEPEGGWFTFVHQEEHKFIRPPGIHAYMCEEKSPEPCNATETFPTGEKYKIVYQESGDYIYYNTSGVGNGLHNRFGDVIAAEYPTAEKAVYIDTHGHKIEELLSKAHHITEIKDLTGGRATKYAYTGTTETSLLETYTDATGAKTKYAYEGPTGRPRQLISITLPSGEVTKITYNEAEQPTAIKRTTNEAHTTGPTTHFAYYPTGETPGKYCTATQGATIVRDPDWVKPEKEETGEKFVLAPHETLYCTNVLEEVERTFDANGNETTTSYDKYENPTSTTAPARETGGKRGVTSIVYDGTGQNVLCEAEGTSGTPLSTCPAGTLEEGYATQQKYNDEKLIFQPTESKSARNQPTTFCYWGGTETCKGRGELEGGSGGALRQAKDPYTGKSKQESLNYAYNPDGTIKISEDPDEHQTHYEYDAIGNLKTIAPAVGSNMGKTSIAVDSDNRPHIVTRCVVLSGETCTSSDIETLTYDNADRVTEAVYTGPGAEKTVKYTYSPDGWLKERTDPTGTTKDVRDPLGRLTEEALPGGISNVYTYDEASNLTTFTDAGGATHYFYNGLNELEAMYEPGGSCSETESKCTKFSYDKDGAPTQTRFASHATLNYQRDAATGRPTAVTVKNPSGTTLLSNTYSYSEGTADTPYVQKDTTSQPGVSTDTISYKYDPLDRIEEATTEGTHPSHYLYELDGAGNRLKQSVNPTGSTGGTENFFSSNAGNELTCRETKNETCKTSGPNVLAEYAYNANGNETTITGVIETGNTGFAYNNLLQVEGLTPPGKAEEKLTYLDAGQANLTAIGTTSLQNSALGLTKQTTEAGTSYYARTPGGTIVDERIAGGTGYNLAYDAQGNIDGLLNTAGELAQSVRYGPYGENTSASGSTPYSALADAFLFQGGYHGQGGDPGSGNVPNGLYHFGERYYDPTSGKWTQQDPAGGVGSYIFAGDDPINSADSSGESAGPPASAFPNKKFRGGPRSLTPFFENVVHKTKHFVDEVIAHLRCHAGEFEAGGRCLPIDPRPPEPPPLPGVVHR